MGSRAYCSALVFPAVGNRSGKKKKKTTVIDLSTFFAPARAPEREKSNPIYTVYPSTGGL
jgi:hypothetical protein